MGRASLLRHVSQNVRPRCGGGGDYGVPPLTAVLQRWAAFDGCSGRPVQSQIGITSTTAWDTYARPAAWSSSTWSWGGTYRVWARGRLASRGALGARSCLGLFQSPSCNCPGQNATVVPLACFFRISPALVRGTVLSNSLPRLGSTYFQHLRLHHRQHPVRAMRCPNPLIRHPRSAPARRAWSAG